MIRLVSYVVTEVVELGLIINTLKKSYKKLATGPILEKIYLIRGARGIHKLRKQLRGRGFACL